MKLNRIFRYSAIMSFLFFIAGNLNQVWGEPVTTIRNSGDPANRVDVVVLGDGYTASELMKYSSDVESAISGFFTQEPFMEYQGYFNVHRVDVISNESGADHPEIGVNKDTAFDATYNCNGIQHLICVNGSKVNAVLSGSVGPNERDIVLVLVNDPEYGGSGGSIAVASTHPSSVELVLHEVGHSFGLLADEYTYGTCNTTVEPSEPNVTMQTDRNLIKWNVGGGPPTGWIDFITLIPTTTNEPGIPGLYEGARYCDIGVYRPTYNSKMRSLGAPFEQINEEQLVKRIHNWVSPLDSSMPAEINLTIASGQPQAFNVSVLEPLTHPLEVRWYVDGLHEQSGLQFVLDTTSLSLDSPSVAVVISDPTSKVRNDPANVLTAQKSWTVWITLPACQGNFDNDGDVDGSDLAVFAADFGRTDCSPSNRCSGDFDSDGDVDGSDLATFAADFGRTDCPSLLPVEVGGHSSHFTNVYAVQLYAEDPNHIAQSISVTGPGIATSLPLTYGVYGPVWWSVPNLELGQTPQELPEPPLTYTFHILSGGIEYTRETIIDSFVHEFATDLSPSGTASGDITFTWTGISDPEAQYHIQLSDGNGTRIWNSPKTTGNSISYTGPLLSPGSTYHYAVVTNDSYGNESLAPADFVYEPVINPQVSSTSGQIGDTLAQPGWGFTPGGTAELHFRRPDETLSPTTTEIVEADGTYEHYWTVPADAQTGTYQYWAVDLSSGLTSPEVDYEIWEWEQINHKNSSWNEGRVNNGKPVA